MQKSGQKSPKVLISCDFPFKKTAKKRVKTLKKTEILTDYESRKTVLLKDLIPNWWGEKRYTK